MKKIFAILLISALTGCASVQTAIDAFLMKYDVNEYQQITDIRTSASLAKATCDNPQEAQAQSVLVSNKTFMFKNYLQYLPHNDKVIAASGDLDKIAQGLKEQYIKTTKVSSAFCKIKFQSIETSAEAMQKVIGDKPR